MAATTQTLKRTANSTIFLDPFLKLQLQEKKWFCYGNKIRDNKFFVAETKNLAAAT